MRKQCVVWMWLSLLLRTDTDACTGMFLYMNHSIFMGNKMLFSLLGAWNLFIVLKSPVPETALWNVLSATEAIGLPPALSFMLKILDSKEKIKAYIWHTAACICLVLGDKSSWPCECGGVIKGVFCVCRNHLIAAFCSPLPQQIHAPHSWVSHVYRYGTSWTEPCCPLLVKSYPILVSVLCPL